MDLTHEYGEDLPEQSSLFLLLGVVLVLLGGLAMATAIFTTITTVFLVGVFLLVAGITYGIDALSCKKWRGAFLNVIQFIFYSLLGCLIIMDPRRAALSFTFSMAIFFSVLGVYRMVSAFSLIHKHCGWLFASGLVTLLLGVLILGDHENYGLWMIGTFLGIDLITNGFSILMLSLNLKREEWGAWDLRSPRIKDI